MCNAFRRGAESLRNGLRLRLRPWRSVRGRRVRGPIVILCGYTKTFTRVKRGIAFTGRWPRWGLPRRRRRRVACPPVPNTGRLMRST